MQSKFTKQTQNLNLKLKWGGGMPPVRRLWIHLGDQYRFL